MRIRAERESDQEAIYQVNGAAFEAHAEAELVEALREQTEPIISLVAEEGGAIVGHIMFSPVSLTADPKFKAMGLAPMAVAPKHQRQGIGSALVRAGLQRCKEMGFRAVVVLGHPEYYPRFGFARASGFGLRCEYEAPEEAFMAMELQAGALAGKSGAVKYLAVFNNV